MLTLRPRSFAATGPLAASSLVASTSCATLLRLGRNDHHDSSQFSPSPSRTTHTAPASRRRGSLRSNLRATRIRNCSLDTSDSAGLMVQTRSASSSPAKGVSVNGAEGQEMTRCQAHETAERAAAPEVRVIVARCGESPLQAPPAGRPRRSRCCSGAPPTWRPF